MRLIDGMIECARQLGQWGITTRLPNLDEPADYSLLPAGERASMKAGLIRSHMEKIRTSDAVLIYNESVDSRTHYIGANSFLEMGFAFAFGKPIYLLNDIPDQPNTDEILGMLPMPLRGDLSRLRS